MFVRHDYIHDHHKVTLTQAIHGHNYITEQMLAKLYRAALDMLESGKTDQAETRASLINGKDDLRIGAATDERTGTYIWLAVTPKSRLMTVGQKWVAEQFDPTTQTTSSKVW